MSIPWPERVHWSEFASPLDASDCPPLPLLPDAAGAAATPSLPNAYAPIPRHPTLLRSRAARVVSYGAYYDIFLPAKKR